MRLTVMTYNIRSGTYNPWGLEGVARVIERRHPDVIGVQEVNVHGYPTGPVDQPAWLAARLGLQTAFGPAREFPEQVSAGRASLTGNALLSRFPIQATDVRRLPPLTPTDLSRSVLGSVVHTPDGPVNVFVTHWSTIRDDAAQGLHAQETVQFARSWRAEPPIVVLGDFNALPDSPALATIRDVLADAWELVGVPAWQRVAFPSGPPGSATLDGWAGAIDHIFVGPGITVETIAVDYDESRASDHNPVVATMRL